MLQKIIYRKATVIGKVAIIIIFALSFITSGFCQHILNVHLVDKDTTFDMHKLNLQSVFKDNKTCSTYIYQLPSILLSKGYPSASIDSVVIGSLSSEIWLFIGNHYSGIKLKIDSSATVVKYWADNIDVNGITRFSKLNLTEQKIIDYYMSVGYPFVTVRLDSISISDTIFSALLKINKGPLYHIDSIRQYGKLKITNSFLQHYLSIYPGSIYDSKKIKEVPKKLSELNYARVIQAPDITMLGTGSILNLYLDSRRSSQFDILVGVIPSSDVSGKAKLTGDVNLNLKNAFKSGETMVVNWQQLQKQSPKLNIGYQQPFIFNSNIGIDENFNLFKKDSSYIQLNGRAGLLYTLSDHQAIQVFINGQRSYLLQGGYDTNQIRINKKLPVNIDFAATSLGIDYQFINTDYKYNPRKGSEIRFMSSAGIKKVSPNNDIINLYDPINPSFNFKNLYDTLGKNNYQFHTQLFAAHYFPSGRKSVLKSAINLAMINSQHLFRNELFIIGGYRLLRGFDEESIYADRYAVLTTEFRYLTGINSFLFLFNDVGVTHTKYQLNNYANNFISAGVGVSFETKAGLLNLSYAVGKRNDVAFNLSGASKIHFGFINYF